MNFIFEQIHVGGDHNLGYLLGDREAGVAALIDPSYAPERLIDRARAQKLEVTHIINTHGHHDHVNGNEQAQALTDAPIPTHAEPATGSAGRGHMSGRSRPRRRRCHAAARGQEASARTDHAYMMRDRVMPDQIHNFAHNNEWLCRNLATIGRAGDAVALARNMISLPRHPKYNTLAKRGGSASHGHRRLLSALEQFEMWEELALQIGRASCRERG
mgnify:CR=1 FL=1